MVTAVKQRVVARQISYPHASATLLASHTRRFDNTTRRFTTSWQPWWKTRHMYGRVSCAAQLLWPP